MESVTETNSCYEQAAKLVLDGLYEGLVLCHGFPMFQGAGKNQGKRVGYAWCELHEYVFDFQPDGEQVLILKKDYYKVAKIVPEQVRRYTAKEVKEKVLSTGHCGIWS